MPVSQCWAVVPAAGIGRRMGCDLPKQYLPLRGQPVIAHTLSRLAGHPRVAGVVVALGPQDPHWPKLNLQLPVPLYTVDGGEERCHSVLNALARLKGLADANDWVLVHDAARPCLRPADIDRLLSELHDHPVGGILGLPVSDTVKRTDSGGNIIATVEREGLWRALTPQMFRLEELLVSLKRAIASGSPVTDEASAIEYAGRQPRMVEGHGDNIKITRPQDLALAELFLSQQENES